MRSMPQTLGHRLHCWQWHQHKLVITSDSTGVENSVQISVTGDGDGNNTDASGLSRLSFNATVGTSNVYKHKLHQTRLLR